MAPFVSDARLLAAAAAAVAVALPAGPAGAATETGLIPSVATIEDGAALIVNPAALGTDRGVGLHLATGGFRSFGTQAYSLSLGLGGAGLGLRHEPTATGDRQEFDFATVIPLAPGVRSGVGYRFGTSAGRSGADWDFGLLMRPTDWISLGGAVRNVGGQLPGDVRNYQLGVGLRPFGDRYTFNADYSWAEGQTPGVVLPWLGVEAEPIDGLTLRAEARYDLVRASATGAGWQSGLSYRVGLGLATPRIDTGGMGGQINSPALDPRNPVPDGAAYVRVRETRGRAVWHGAGEILQLKLQGNLGPDRPGLNLISSIAEKPPVANTLEVLDRAVNDRAVRGLALSVEGIGASLADVQEVRAAIKRVREAGKPVVAYLSSGGFKELYLASAADRLLINPVGALDFTGFSIQELYVRGLLAKVGVKAEFVHTGPYKTAMESMTRDSMSEANREQLDALQTDQFEQIVSAIAEGRKKTPAEIRAQIDRGILSAPMAVDAGLVDDQGNPDDLEGAAGKLAGSTHLTDAFKRPVRMRSWAPPRIAVVYASGGIAEGYSGNDLLMGRILGADTLVAALKEAREDDQTRAVVLRIDSPGGSAIASEAIRREIERTRAQKPVIVSMGGVAASGGYWIACGSDRILADPGTITGSIGVVVGKYSVEDLLKKNDINVETVAKGRFAGLSSPFHALAPEERALLQSTADFTYARFLQLVSHARKMPQMRVKELAGGRIYSGSRALQVGLIDREAGMLAALEEARMTAGISQDAEVEIAYLPHQRPFLLTDDAMVVFDVAYQARKAVAATERWTRGRVWLLDPSLAP